MLLSRMVFVIFFNTIFERLFEFVEVGLEIDSIASAYLRGGAGMPGRAGC